MQITAIRSAAVGYYLRSDGASRVDLGERESAGVSAAAAAATTWSLARAQSGRLYLRDHRGQYLTAWGDRSVQLQPGPAARSASEWAVEVLATRSSARY